MGDAWTDRLSEYIDDELAPRERSALEAHLAGCPECAGIVEDLRAVAARAAALPDTPPGVDLWPGIEARLEGDVGVRVISLPERRHRFSFTLPQLAAAGVALVAVSSTLVWLLTRSPAAAPGPLAVNTPGAATQGGPPATFGASVPRPATVSGEAATAAAAAARVDRVATADQASGSGALRGAAGAARRADAGAPRPRAPVDGRVRARFASTGTLDAAVTRDYDRAVGDLEAVLRRGRSHLQPETIAVVEKSLHDIDVAIAEARRALAKDPANEYLNDHLAESMRLKLELLRQTAALTQS